MQRPIKMMYPEVNQPLFFSISSLGVTSVSLLWSFPYYNLCADVTPLCLELPWLGSPFIYGFLFLESRTAATSLPKYPSISFFLHPKPLLDDQFPHGLCLENSNQPFIRDLNDFGKEEMKKKAYKCSQNKWHESAMEEMIHRFLFCLRKEANIGKRKFLSFQKVLSDSFWM